MSERGRILHEQVVTDPSSLRSIFSTLAKEPDLDDKIMDQVLGLPVFKYNIEPRNIDSETRLQIHYGQEKFINVATPYNFIKLAVNALNPQQSDVVYDLGCGFGRFPFYGALTTDATYVGVEILPHRIQAAQAIKDQFDITNVDFIRANVRNVDFSDGTHFYLYNPFTEDTNTLVRQKLYQLSRRTRIKLALVGFDLPPIPWLHMVSNDIPLLKIYESK